MRRLALVVLLLLAAPRVAGAYEFEVIARTLGQGYQLRSFRLMGGDVILSRRRFTQMLGLEIRDIGRRRTDHRPGGPRVGFSTYLRLDHDFGDWTMGELERDGRPIDAIDAIPELTASSLALDVLYAYVSVDGLAGGMVDLRAGRQVELDRFDAWAWDGASVKVHTKWHVAAEASGGLRVRDASPVAPAAYELDGTASGACREYVEGATPGTGSWQLVDRSRVPDGSAFTSDLDYCPQRLEPMPVVQVAVETEHLRRWHARASYRRAMSPTVGLIGPVDRLDNPDTGFYPNEHGQAPAWGVNEEQVALTADASLGRVQPWVGVRYSLLHAAVADAAVGARVRLGAHAIEPSFSYARPIFDGDSIFNAFVTYPSLDARVHWRWRGFYAETWARRYDLGDASAYAGGADAGLAWRNLGVDALADGGWGGRRLGATAHGSWRANRWTTYAARAAILRFVDDSGTTVQPGRIHGSVSLGGAWEVVSGVGVRAIAEGTSSRVNPAELRVLFVLDLAFQPEM